MLSLWGDGWFYVSGGGFLISCLLFVFLLGQYRAAIEAEEETEDEPLPAGGAPVERVYVPRAIEPIVPIVHRPMPSIEPVLPALAPVARAAPGPADESSPALPPVSQAEAPKPAEKKKDATTTGSLSPAVVYLQSLKAQIDHLDKELELLRGLASQQSAQGELILSRLSEVGERLSALETTPVAAAAPAAEAAPEPAPEPVTAEPESRTVVLQPPPAEEQAASVAEPMPAPEAQSETAAAAEFPAPVPEATRPAPETQAEPEQKPARKGPVWPI